MDITRRDFLNGAALAVGTPAALAQAPAGYPPERAGLQGQTDDLRTTGHILRDDPAHWRHAAAAQDSGVEDLVVVGAGLSGLAGAWLYRQHAGRPARVLLLDALDDFGGHARRNEFISRSGRRLVGYGGSQSLDTPGLFSPAVHSLLRGVGIDLARFKTEFFDHGWAQRHGLVNSARFFGRAAWGVDSMVVRKPGEPPAQWLARTPLPRQAQLDAARLLRGMPARSLMPGLNRGARRTLLAQTTYRDFLLSIYKCHPAVATYWQQETMGSFGVGIDATSALDAWAAGLSGFKGLDLGSKVDPRMSPSGRQLMAGRDEYIYHFPDGNAGVARALLRGLLPQAVPGQGMASLAGARVDYGALDIDTNSDANDVRVRLQASVVSVQHQGAPASAQTVALRYVDSAGRLREVIAKQVLLACWHRTIARITTELPAAQVEALNDQVKVPLLYANVLVSNWHAWQRAGIAAFSAPGGFWQEVALDFPVNMGEVRFAAQPRDPMLVHLATVLAPKDGRDARSQAAAGRAMLMQWSFADLEREARAVLQGALGAYGFDHAREIEAITVNRWAHGYAYEYMRPWDAAWPAGPLPCETARRGWGRVAIANADAGAYAYAHSAIDQATRAVQELLPHAALPEWNAFPGPAPGRIGLV